MIDAMFRRPITWALLGVLAGCGGGAAADAWQPAPGTPDILAATDLWVFSETDVWVLDGGPAVHRFDGSTWSTLATPATGGLGCIFARSATEVWLCAGTEVLRWDGTTFTATEVATPTGLSNVSDLWASSPDDVWVIGDDAIVGHFDGTSWSGTLAGSPFNASIWGSGPDDVYVLGTFELVHFDGTAWEEVTLDGGAGGDGEVWGTSASDVWVMTGSSDLAHFDGAAWEVIETHDFVGDLAAVWGPSADDLWAVGGAGSIAHYDGTSWDEVAHQRIGAPYLRQLQAVHGSSPTHVWAVGSELGEAGSTGLVYRYVP